MKTNMTIHSIHVDGFQEPHQLKPYCVDGFAFSFLVEGEVLLDVEGKNLLVSAGQFVIVPANMTMSVKHFNGCKCFDGFFRMDFLKDASYPVLHATQPVVQSFWFDDAVFIAALLQRMLTAYEDKDKAFLKSGLDLILCQYRNGNRNATIIPERFLQLVFDRNQAPKSVAEYAEELQVTANYLNKTIKAHTHRTAIDWIEIARLNMAKLYLQDKNMPIAEIAEKTGLVDQSYFSRFFKKKTGMTPSQYRNSL